MQRAAGPELELALRARQLSEDLSGLVPEAGFRPHGSLTLAVTQAEADLLTAAADIYRWKRRGPP